MVEKKEEAQGGKPIVDGENVKNVLNGSVYPELIRSYPGGKDCPQRHKMEK